MQGKYDFVVIGSGPAGRRAAIQASKAGKSVLVIDKGQWLGGVCVHTGTIPSKTFRETVLNLSGWRERGFYGLGYRVKDKISADDLKKRLALTIQYEVEVLENQFRRNRVDRAFGKAKFAGQNIICITNDQGERIYVDFIKAIICTGTKPFRPDYIPFDGEKVLDCDEIIQLEKLPKSLTIIGAGVVGVEYASIFNALDIPVTLIEPREKILDFMDRELVDTFLNNLRSRGVVTSFGQEAVSIKSTIDSCLVKMQDGRVFQSEMVLFAAGRIGATQYLGLENFAIETDHRGRIPVNPHTFQTKANHIYAAGDVIGFPSLASTSMEQGRRAACHAFDIQMALPPDYFPYGIYAVPEISTIGLTEDFLKEKNIPYQCGIARLTETSRGQIMGMKHGMMKMIFSLETKQLLGVHIIGEGATELIHIGQAVLNLGGGLDYFIDNIFNYPTLAEAYKVAALDAWNRMQNINLEKVIEGNKIFHDDDPASPLNFLEESDVA